ncbi:MAG: EamA family transporter RarD [Pseudomonadota bacterium]
MLYTFGSSLMWGLMPIYFKSLQTVPAFEIMLHRIVWSLLFIVLLLSMRKQWSWLRSALRQPKVLAGFALSAFLLSGSWYVYVWAVNNGQVVDASLGYFITPLANVLLGFLLLKERLRPVQWAAVALATAGVAWLGWQSGHVPWIGIGMAATFGIYGLLRKTAALGALEGLALETLILFPLAAVTLGVLAFNGNAAFSTAPGSLQWLLLAAGPLTVVPLLMFAAGARRVSMSLLGIMQYFGPMLQLVLAVWLYGESFSGARMAGFAIIWAALALYSGEGIWRAWVAKRRA